MHYIVIDLEASCAESNNNFQMETIEFGAIRLDGKNNGSDAPEFVFQDFVKPVINPTLTKFCKNLTNIRQEDVDKAKKFPQIFNKFIKWCGREPFILVSWGFYDKKQLQKDCVLHRIDFPQVFENHVSAKHLFSAKHKIKPCGLSQALNLLNLKFQGTPHRALDDAENVAIIWETLV